MIDTKPHEAAYFAIMQKRSSMGSDINRVAKSIVDLATGNPIAEELHPLKNQAAVELGRLGGLKGGKARAEKLSAKKRKEIAKKAADARWNKQSGDK